MFKENGRAGRAKDKRAVASVSGKEFACSACGSRKRLTNVEFGEEIICDCGKPMVESYEQ